MREVKHTIDRELKFSPVALDRVELDGTFQGYASIFGKEDLGHDIILPGAFSASLAARGASGIKLLFQHDPAEPIGVWLDVHEDATGLYARGRLMQDVARGREVLSLMRAGALDGLSIGFRTVKGRTDARTGVRRIQQVDLWEISVVTFPMLPEARISAVKNRFAPAGMTTQRQFERWLTQDAGLTRNQARALMRNGYKAFAATRDAAGKDDARFAEALRRAARVIAPDTQTHPMR